jgi:hypothetical protein
VLSVQPRYTLANEELSMTDTASHSVPEQGKFRRALAAVWAFLQAMESTSFDYTLDRIEHIDSTAGASLEARIDRAPLSQSDVARRVDRLDRQRPKRG